MTVDHTFTDWAWQNIGKAVDGATALVLLRLAREADLSGSPSVKASLKALTAGSGVANSTVSRQIEILMELGLVSRRKRFDPDTGAALPTEYTLHVDRNVRANPEAVAS